jgi:hypothetical protein
MSDSRMQYFLDMDIRQKNNINEAVTYTASPSSYNSIGSPPFFRRVSWGAILAGTPVALVSMLVLNLLGIGMGLGAIDPMEEAKPLAGLGTGAIIWWVVSNLIAIFAGGYVGGRLSGIPLRSTSTLHGILSWCLYTLASFWLLTTAFGSLISEVGSVVSETLTRSNVEAEAAAENGLQDQAGLISMNEIKNELSQVLDNNVVSAAPQEEEINRTTDGAARHLRQNLSNEVYVPEEEIEQIARDKCYRNGKLVDNIDRQDLSNTIHNRTNLSSLEVRDVANVMLRKYREAKREADRQREDRRREAEEKGQRVAQASSTAAIWAFVSLVLGAVVSGVGGRLGKPDEVLLAGPKPINNKE